MQVVVKNLSSQYHWFDFALLRKFHGALGVWGIT